MKIKISIAILLWLANININIAQQSLTLDVRGNCDMCKEKIETTAKSTIGVQSALYSLDLQQLVVQYQSGIFQQKELEDNILAIGYDVGDRLATADAYNNLPKCCQYTRDLGDVAQFAFVVSGECEMCKERIEQTALSVSGVKSASWSSTSKMLTLTTDKTFDVNTVHQKLAAVGHATDKLEANHEAYDQLPNCCKYREHKELHGVLYGKSGKTKESLIGAVLQWQDKSSYTTTDENGHFDLMIPDELPMNLIVSYIGYKTDTLSIEKAGNVELVLTSNDDLTAIVVVGKRKSIEISYINPIKVQRIGQRELVKAACCNLSESFDTNPAVDVSFTDAITGTKQIEMLGLAGPYVQITKENMPDIRGLAALYGFTFIPGPWIQGIQLVLGSGSVINGYESIAGQINVELKKPFDKEKLHVNGYAGDGGRYELNLIANTTASKRWDTGILGHISYRTHANDRNYDGFLDMPIGHTYSISNNWQYFGDNGNEAQVGAKFTQVTNEGGQHNDFHTDHPSGFQLWQSKVATNRMEAWMKRGKVWLDKPYMSLGFQLSGVYHDQKAYFGSRQYDGIQKNIYANLIFKSRINSDKHGYTVGLSTLLEKTDETLDIKYARNEKVFGAFAEYAYKLQEKLDIVAGIRADHHNNFGLFFTPRLHVRYAPNQNHVFRASAGRGQRTASIFAENIGMFASNRAINIQGTDANNPYGLNPEVAWNYGANYLWMTKLFNKEFQVSVDAYYTRFVSQVVIDWETATQVNIYNLDGKSFSKSLQMQVDYSPVKDLELRLAARYNDVQVDYKNGQLRKPLSSPYRVFGNVAYALGSWKVDYTLNWQSYKRLPNTSTNPAYYQFASQSPSYFLSNAQVTKSFKKVFELYVGCENIANYKQNQAIIAAGETNSPYFDSSIVWAPVFGRMFYAGFRYALQKGGE